MKEQERVLATGLVVLLLILWLGFLVHQSPRFAGSFRGGMLAVSGTALMLVPLAYLFVKRIKRLKKFVTQFVSMRTLLAWHIYAGILGPILVLMHTGHKFESPLGIALTAMTLIVVLSGFIGRYLMQQFSQEIREKKALLAELTTVYNQAEAELVHHPHQVAALRPFAGFFSRWAAGIFLRAEQDSQSSDTAGLSTVQMLRLAEAIADVEYALATHEQFKIWFGKWLRIHIVISFALYALLVLHIYFAVYFGLRWFE